MRIIFFILLNIYEKKYILNLYKYKWEYIFLYFDIIDIYFPSPYFFLILFLLFLHNVPIWTSWASVKTLLGSVMDCHSRLLRAVTKFSRWQLVLLCPLFHVNSVSFFHVACMVLKAIVFIMYLIQSTSELEFDFVFSAGVVKMSAVLWKVSYREAGWPCPSQWVDTGD